MAHGCPLGGQGKDNSSGFFVFMFLNLNVLQ